MNNKITTNSQLSTTEYEKPQRKLQTTRTVIDSWKWRSQVWLSVGRGGVEWGKNYRE